MQIYSFLHSSSKLSGKITRQSSLFLNNAPNLTPASLCLLKSALNSAEVRAWKNCFARGNTLFHGRNKLFPLPKQIESACSKMLVTFYCATYPLPL